MNVLDIRGMPAHSPSKKAFGFFVGEPLHYSVVFYVIKKGYTSKTFYVLLVYFYAITRSSKCVTVHSVISNPNAASWKNKTPEYLVKKCQRGYNKKKYPEQQVPAGRWNYYAESDNNWTAIWQWRT